MGSGFDQELHKNQEGFLSCKDYDRFRDSSYKKHDEHFWEHSNYKLLLLPFKSEHLGKIQDTGLTLMYGANMVVSIFCCKLNVLASLPAKDVTAGMEHIKNIAPPEAKHLVQYFDETYISGKTRVTILQVDQDIFVSIKRSAPKIEKVNWWLHGRDPPLELLHQSLIVSGDGSGHGNITIGDDSIMIIEDEDSSSESLASTVLVQENPQRSMVNPTPPSPPLVD